MHINLSEAINYLVNGRVIAVPTETVYGLAASLAHEQAIKDIFTLKGRPQTNPLIIHVAEVGQIEPYVATFPPCFLALAETFWPGPMTLVLPIHSHLIFPAVRAGLATAGFRIPQHPLALELLRHTGPLVMPSANLSGKPSATRPDHIEEDFGISFPILDGGACTKGLESTILYYKENRWVILRLGSLAPEAFREVLGYQPDILLKVDSHQTLCPGQLFRHYAPKARLLLDDLASLDGVPFILGFDERQYPADKKVIRIGSLLDVEQVAKNLYQALRQLDQEEATVAWIDMNFPQGGLWLTLAERLKRAAETKP